MSDVLFAEKKSFHCKSKHVNRKTYIKVKHLFYTILLIVTACQFPNSGQSIEEDDKDNGDEPIQPIHTGPNTL